MKNPLLLLLIIVTTISNAQTFRFQDRRNIQVNGTAKKEVIPNKIKLQVVLREKGEGKKLVPIDILEKEFRESLKIAKVNDDAVSLDKATSQLIKNSKKKGKIITSKTYFISLTDFQKSYVLINTLNSKKIQYSIRSKSHTELDKFKKEVEIEAFKNAQNKAEYLLAQAKCKKGRLLAVSETALDYYDQGYDGYLNAADYGYEQERSEDNRFSPIFISASIYATFEIVD